MAKTNFQYEKRQKDLEKKRKKEEKLKKKADKANQPDVLSAEGEENAVMEEMSSSLKDVPGQVDSQAESDPI